MSDATFEVSTKDLALLVKPIVPLAGKDYMLPLLRAVRFQAHGKYLTASATDRFRIGISRIELGTEPPADLDFLLGLDELARLLSVFKSNSTMERHVTITVLRDRIKVEQAFGFGFIDASMSFSLTDGEYPRLAHLFDKDNWSDPVAINGINAAYLADFRHAPHGGEPLVIRSGNERKPLVVTAGEHFIGAIMPVRVESDLNAIDTWTDALAAISTMKPAITPATKASRKKAVA